MTHILSLIGLSLLCVLWLIFQQWLARQDPEYKGYQAGCGGCTRSCGEKEQQQRPNTETIQFADASGQWSKYSKK